LNCCCCGNCAGLQMLSNTSKPIQVLFLWPVIGNGKQPVIIPHPDDTIGCP
jgi:hypothetical protein